MSTGKQKAPKTEIREKTVNSAKQRRINENRYLHQVKVSSHGFGQRERKRLLSGKRVPTTQADLMFLVDMGREDLIPKQ